MDPQKIGAAGLIKKFFACENQEIMSLPSEARVQLGSAIAREQKLAPDTLNFVPVEY